MIYLKIPKKMCWDFLKRYRYPKRIWEQAQNLVWFLGRFLSRLPTQTLLQALRKWMWPDIQELAMRRGVMWAKQCWELDDGHRIRLKSFFMAWVKANMWIYVSTIVHLYHIFDKFVYEGTKQKIFYKHLHMRLTDWLVMGVWRHFDPQSLSKLMHYLEDSWSLFRIDTWCAEVRYD